MVQGNSRGQPRLLKRSALQAYEEEEWTQRDDCEDLVRSYLMPENGYTYSAARVQSGRAPAMQSLWNEILMSGMWAGKLHKKFIGPGCRAITPTCSTDLKALPAAADKHREKPIAWKRGSLLDARMTPRTMGTRVAYVSALSCFRWHSSANSAVKNGVQEPMAWFRETALMGGGHSMAESHRKSRYFVPKKEGGIDGTLKCTRTDQIAARERV